MKQVEVETTTSEQILLWIFDVTDNIVSFSEGLANPWLIVLVIITGMLLFIGIFFRNVLYFAFNAFIIGLVIFFVLKFSGPISNFFQQLALSN